MLEPLMPSRHEDEDTAASYMFSSAHTSPVAASKAPLYVMFGTSLKRRSNSFWKPSTTVPYTAMSNLSARPSELSVLAAAANVSMPFSGRTWAKYTKCTVSPTARGARALSPLRKLGK